MADRYRSAQSPRDSEMPGEFGDERFRKLVQETSKGISSFNQVTRGIAQKMSLFGTPQDSRANHTAVTELTDKGQKLVSRLNKRLQELHKACQSGDKRAMRKAQVSKLSSDFKAQLKSFEDTCKRLVETERHSVDLIRRSSTSFRGQKPAGNEFSNYSEDQIYAQANVVIYDEDDLVRREEDIIHINHQLREVNAAFQEIDGLIQDQGEVVVEIADNTETAKENVSKALDQVKQADERKRYCACGRTKMICYIIFAVVILLMLLGIIVAVA